MLLGNLRTSSGCTHRIGNRDHCVVRYKRKPYYRSRREIEDGLVDFQSPRTHDPLKSVTQFSYELKTNCERVQFYHRSAMVRTRELHNPDASQAYSSQM
jgi:hypothetical protein